MAKSKPVYPGELGQPIYIDIPRWARRSKQLDDGDFNKELSEHIQNERQRRVALLFKHYEITPGHRDAWKLLAQKLSVAHVPGLQFTEKKSKKAGRPWAYGVEYMLEFLNAVDASREEIARKTGSKPASVSVLRGITGLKKRAPQKWTGAPASLVVRYSEFNKLLGGARAHTLANMGLRKK